LRLPCLPRLSVSSRILPAAVEACGGRRRRAPPGAHQRRDDRSENRLFNGLRPSASDQSYRQDPRDRRGRTARADAS